MSENPMTYEEFAEDLANAYPDLDLQELTVDDIKIMMSHALKIEPNKYGLTPASECPPPRRRSSNRNNKVASFSSHGASACGLNQQKDASSDDAFVAAAILEQNANKYHDHNHIDQLNLDPSIINSDMSKLPLATAQALYASAALLSISRGQGSGIESNQTHDNLTMIPSTTEVNGHALTNTSGTQDAPQTPAFQDSNAHSENPTTVMLTSNSASVYPANKSVSSMSSKLMDIPAAPPGTDIPVARLGDSNKLRQLLQAGHLALVDKWAEEEAELNANNSAATSAEDKQASQHQVSVIRLALTEISVDHD